MSGGHVEIHDLLSNHNGLTDAEHCDPKSTSDSMEDTPEFRLLMAYAKRRRPADESPAQDTSVNGGTNTSDAPQTPAETEKQEKKKKKEKKFWKRHIFSCIKPQTEDKETPRNNVRQPDTQYRCVIKNPEVNKEDGLEKVASRLTEIADDIPFIPPDVEADCPEDVNVERVIGLLLREAGDKLNEQELLDASVAAELFWKYSFFEKLIMTLLTRMGLRSQNPDSPGPKASPKTQIAVTCEVTSRLSAVRSLPGSQLLDHGARYLQHHYSAWAQQQGGYEEAFYSDDEDDIQ